MICPRCKRLFASGALNLALTHLGPQFRFGDTLVGIRLRHVHVQCSAAGIMPRVKEAPSGRAKTGVLTCTNNALICTGQYIAFSIGGTHRFGRSQVPNSLKPGYPLYSLCVQRSRFGEKVLGFSVCTVQYIVNGQNRFFKGKWMYSEVG